jgi:isopentenyl phosphate kinase
MNEKPLKEYVSLEKRKKEIAAELKQVSADLNRLEVVVVDEIVNAGVQEVTVDGRILKPVPAIFCSPAKGRLAVVDALREAHLDEFIPPDFNDARLRSYVKEMAQDVFVRAGEEVADALPAPLGPVLKIYLSHELSSRAKPAPKKGETHDDAGIDNGAEVGVA